MIVCRAAGLALPRCWCSPRLTGRHGQDPRSSSSNVIVAILDPRQPERVGRLPAPLRGRARVEDLEAVGGRLVQRDVRVAEDHRVRVGEAAPQPRQAPARPARRRGPSRSARPRTRAVRCSGSRGLEPAVVARCRGRRAPAARAPAARRSTDRSHQVPGVQDRVGADAESARPEAAGCPAACGCRRSPRGARRPLSYATPSARSSVDRARASGARGHRFESCRARHVELVRSGSAR